MRIRGWGAMAGALALAACLAWTMPAAGQTSAELVVRGEAAGADVRLLEAVRARAERAGLAEDATVRLLEPAVAAAEAGLPSRPVLQKALEGMSKGVPADRVAVVLTRLQGALGRAAALVDPWLERPGVRGAVAAPARGADGDDPVRAVLVESVGTALDAEASPVTIQALLDRIPRGLGGERVPALGLGVAVEVLPEVPVADRDPGLAADLVLDALVSGFAAAELRELPAALRAAERRGQLPAEAVARGAMAQMGELPALSVLQNLFQGDFPGNVPFDLPPGLERVREGKGKAPGPP